MATPFRKYSSIDDFYESSEESRADMRWVVMDKLDGSNMAFYFEPGKKCRIGSREEILGDWDKIDWQKGFFDACGSDPSLRRLISFWEDRARIEGKAWHLYGELVGPKINRRVWYGPHHLVRFFDMRFENSMLPACEFLREMRENGFKDLIVPIFLENVDYGQASHFDTNIPDPIAVPPKPLKINPRNIIEGVVIKPYEAHLLNRYGHRTLLRTKNEMFIERKRPRERKPAREQPKEAMAKGDIFCGYFNEARMLSCFSKKGRIEEKSQLGDYIKAILADMEEDFLKENSWDDDGWRRAAMKRATGQIVKALQGTLGG